jgi:hypothetical protein
MKLNDFGALIEGGRLLSKAHHEHRSNREVGCHQDANTVTISEALTKLIESLVGEPCGADDGVDATLDTPGDVVHHRVGVSEIDDHFRGFGGCAVFVEVDCCNKLQVGLALHSTAHFGAHSATGSEHSDPGHERPPFDLSVSLTSQLYQRESRDSIPRAGTRAPATASVGGWLKRFAASARTSSALT